MPGKSDNLFNIPTHRVRGFLIEDGKILENSQRAFDLLVGKVYFICDSFFLYGKGNNTKHQVLYIRDTVSEVMITVRAEMISRLKNKRHQI